MKIKLLDNRARIPEYATEGAGAFDLTFLETTDGYLTAAVRRGFPVTCRTGIAVQIPAGFSLLILSRSGHGFNHDVRLANCVGLIDSDYRGEILVKLTTDGAPFNVRSGARIAQAVLIHTPQVGAFELVENLDSTERGAGGFGSTGNA